ncbi:MAG TPA: hypothetical protein VMK83_09775 [Gaiellaceae bacterium]|nr:hypothetical protein [Gaiellaceae bacterium]
MADPSETTQISREQSLPEGELAGAVRALAAQVGSLQADVQALRVETRALPSSEADRHGWDEGAPIVREGPAWVRSVDSPRARGLAIPWLLVEIVFLVAVAVLAIVAELDPYAIAGVMLGAWALVALGEWLAARGARQRLMAVYGAEAGSTVVAPAQDDRAWFDANGDDTLLDGRSAERPPARLPPPE